MAQKRPFNDDDNVEVSTKHPRQWELGNQLYSSPESVLPEDDSHITHTAGEGGLTPSNTGLDENVASDVFAECQKSADNIETSRPGCISISSLPSGSTVEESSYLESPLCDSLFSENFNPVRPTRTMTHYGDIYSLLLNLPPRKSIPIGSNHQADIPVWAPRTTRNTSNHVGASEPVLDSEHFAKNEKEEILMGTCIIPMPDSGFFAYDDEGKVGKGRSDCHCEDQGSVRCIRQHILETRTELRECLGHDVFMELGFLNMGEAVADKWSNEEEELFHKTIFCNPASLGKKFWEILSAVFPSRTKMDIVSYYYNVFMLRRRAEQNRCYPMNINSDNDEWQGPYDSEEEDEDGMSDEDEDSVIESPVYHVDNHGYNQSQRGDLCVYEDDVVEETCNGFDGADFVCGGGTNSVSEACSGKVVDNAWNVEKRGREVQDDSCTSSDTGAPSQLKTDHHHHHHHHHWLGGFNGYVFEPCDDKAWDTGYIDCNLNKVDFLPTCSMIEEVFGDGSGNHKKARDSKSLN